MKTNEEIIEEVGYDESLSLSPLADNIGLTFNDTILKALSLKDAEVKKAIEEYLDGLYFEMFDELKFYHKLRYKKDMAKKFQEIFDFWVKKNEELYEKLGLEK